MGPILVYDQEILCGSTVKTFYVGQVLIVLMVITQVVVMCVSSHIAVVVGSNPTSFATKMPSVSEMT